MKKICLVLVLISCFILTGCNKDKQADDFMKDFDSLTTEICEKLEDGKINEARKVFDEEKGSLKSEWEAMRGAWKFQFGDGIKKRMNTEPVENMAKVVKSANKTIEKYPKETVKVQSIVNDLSNLLK